MTLINVLCGLGGGGGGGGGGGWESDGTVKGHQILSYVALRFIVNG